MRKMLVLALVLCLVGVAAASDTGNQAPTKIPGVYPVNIPNPVLQGGDVIPGTVIGALPYDDSGTTVGYANNYGGSCVGSSAPDVVYSFTPSESGDIIVSLCGSSYDTGLEVFDSGMNEIACNDDFCGLQSEVSGVGVVAGSVYYIIVDGYSTASGAYVINVRWDEPCILDCPAGAFPEGEPALVPNYVDNYNGGCNTPSYPFQVLEASDNDMLTLCGVSGWYLSDGSQFRDTDWYIINMGDSGAIEATMNAEYATYFFELGPQDCVNIGVVQQVIAGPCVEGFMTISGYAAGAPVWFWAGPTVFAAPGEDDMYDYMVWFSGLEPVASEGTTMSSMKALFQ